jgi:hypothetical protein
VDKKSAKTANISFPTVKALWSRGFIDLEYTRDPASDSRKKDFWAARPLGTTPPPTKRTRYRREESVVTSPVISRALGAWVGDDGTKLLKSATASQGGVKFYTEGYRAENSGRRNVVYVSYTPGEDTSTEKLLQMLDLYADILTAAKAQYKIVYDDDRLVVTR